LEQVNIFSRLVRTDSSPMTEAEGEHAFLNRVAGEYWDDVRDLMEEWLARYPNHKAPELARRLQADSRGFWGAYLELFLHQFFSQSGASVDVEPELSGRRPDFRVSIDGMSLLVEAKALYEPEKDTKRNRRTALVIDRLRKVQSADFIVSLHDLVQGSQQPSSTQMAADLDQWLSQLIWEELRATIQRSSAGLPTTTLENRGWMVTVRAIPRAEDKRIPGPLVIAPPMQGRVARDYAAIKDDLEQKATKYRSSGEPIVLAFMNTRWTAGLGEAALALYGAAWEHPRMLRERRVDQGYSPTGLWLTHTGSHYSEVVAVLEVEGVGPWHLAEGRVTAWHNPDTALSAVESLDVDHVTVGLEGLQRRESPRSLMHVLGIPAGWPRGGAFPQDS
jgi:hypothetical protein